MRRLVLLLGLYCIAMPSARAQVCQGSGGVAVFSTNFANGLPGKSDMNYTDSVPPRGFFSVKRTTAGLNPNWATVTASGLNGVVIVNSAGTTKYIYRDTLRTLCAATTYAFTANIRNLIIDKSSSASVTFVAQTSAGTQQQLQYASTGGPGIDETGFVFTTPATGGDVVLSILVNPALTPNDEVFSITGIRVQNCGPRITASFDKLSIATREDVCEGTTKTYQLSGLMFERYNNPFYQWQMQSPGAPGWADIPGATQPDYTYQLVNAVAGLYSFRLISGRTENKNTPTCVGYSNAASIVVSKYPIATITATDPVCEGGSLTLNAEGGTSYYWTGPNGFASNKKSPIITNVSQANAGTYHVAVTTNACTTNAQMTIAVNTKPKAIVNANVMICKGGETTLSASGGTTYLWTPTSGLSDPKIAGPIASPTATTTYTVKFFNAAGCVDSTNTTVTVNENPTANAGPDQATLQQKPVTLDGKINNAASYYWTPADYLNDPTSLRPIATPPFDITYTLHALPLAPCAVERTDEVQIKVYNKVTVPNTFSPNADGVNDTWTIIGLDGYPTSLTQVFNRYGTEVYRAVGYPKPWDGRVNGKPLAAGTFYYKIDLMNGVVMAGWVAVVR